MKIRILSIVLSICMVIAFMPQMAFAEEAGNPYTFIDGTTVDNQNEVATKLIDGTSATKWCVTNFSSAYIIFKTSTAVTVSGYSITTGNDNERNKGRNPKNWTLYGCNDESAGRNSASWVPRHRVTNDKILKDENNTTYNFAFDNNETEYQYYKLEITAIQSGDVMQMSEFKLIYCDHRWETTVSNNPTCTAAGYTTRTCSECKGTDYVYLAPVDHDFTGEGGTCTICGYTADKFYVDENGISCPINGNPTEITEGLTTWNDKDANSGWYIVKSNVTLNSVTVSGNVHLVLADGCNLKVNGDITEGRLTIYGQSGGTGTLDVTGRITGGYGEGRTGVGGGNITISGGVVKAESITGGTGGDGFVVEGQPPTFYNGSVGGDITISGGVVEAGSITGGKGGNSQGGTGGRGGNITISGGVVKAESITGGIGGIDPRDGRGGGSVAITGGVVDATSITGGYGNGSIGKDGSVDITGGIVFQSDDGQVYGTDVTLSKSFTISEGKTLTIGSDNNLIIPDGVILTNNGTINNNGIITNNGKIYVDGTFTGTADNLYYPLTIVDATASGDTSEHNSKNYGKAGSTITLTPYTLSTGYKFCGWDVSPANTVTMVGDNTYTITMPREALTITAQYKDITAPVISGIEDGKTYCSAQTVTVSDNDSIQSVTVNGSAIDLVNNQFTLSPAVGAQEIIATDNAGNNKTVTVTVNNGHTYGAWQSNGDRTHTRYCTVDGCNGYEDSDCDGGEASYFKKAVCDICHAEYGNLLTDSTVPTGEITVGTNKWRNFLNTITFGIFFKNTQTVTITASDDSYSHAGYTDDKAVKVEYYLYSGDTALTNTDLASKTFTAYNGAFNINPDNKYVVYARLTDHTGNVTYISSEGVVLDATAPVISGIENGKTYCSAQTVTVTEEYIKSVTVNGTAVTLDGNKQLTLPAKGTQTIVVTDRAGNETSVTVTVNDGHTYEWQEDNGQYWKKCKFCGDETAKKDIPTVTINGADAVCITQEYKFSFTLPQGATDPVYGYEFENKGDSGLPAIIENNELFGIVPVTEYEPSENSFKVYAGAKTADGFEFFVSKTVVLRSEHTDTAPKDHICDICGATLSEHSGGEATCTNKAICEYCGNEYGELDSSNHNLEKIPAKAASVTETGNNEYWCCLDCGKYFADENGTNEIELSDAVTQKLPPEIIEGKGQSLTAGEKKELTFRSNAAFSDFIRVELDGVAVDAENYTATEGSTIITLKADYVATLSAGEHTIGIVSESGTATATFTVNAKAVVNNDTKSPQTGDNNNIAMWIALLFVSGGLLTVTGVYGKRKTH